MNRRKRRSGDHGHVNHERWLISYADFITLLFAFFVVLYSSARTDQTKAKRFSQAIQQAFTQLGMFTPASTHLILTPTEAGSGQEAPPAPAPLVQLRNQLKSELAAEIAAHAISLQLNRDGLTIRLEELGFYPSGSDQLRPEAMPVLAKIARALATMPNAVRIEGHTDNVPIHTARFQSNWQLSTARATELVRAFVTDYGIAPARLSAAGYAEFHPIASNTTAAGRQLNRRVDVVVVALPAVAAPPLPATAPAPPASPHTS